MKKAKTKNKIFSILCAILSAVFAVYIGVTYCGTSLTLEYGNDPKSTTAYLANQQYKIINDTKNNPIKFGEGSHNVEIALQYAFDYDIDVRLEYSLSWSGGSTVETDNVILNFADRDNIIYDEKYIYLADPITAGNGKLTIITGVDFVDVDDETYFGQTLTINITNEKILKTQDTYSSQHKFYVSTSTACDMWLKHKNGTGDKNYAMVYNYRRNYDQGVKYPGLDTAYQKIEKVDGKANELSNAEWTGGNRAYAGLGMYVITGSADLYLQVKVAGIWRQKTADSQAVTNVPSNSGIISENSIKFNYTADWTHVDWDDVRLWETRNYNFCIPANTNCYVDILESIEIISAGRLAVIGFDAYRLVTNSITINGAEEPLQYTEQSCDYIRLTEIVNTTITTSTSAYAKKDISVVNTSLYSSGLYVSTVGHSAQQSFNTNLSVINNTSATKYVEATINLYYYISNGETLLTKDDPITDGNQETAEGESGDEEPTTVKQRAEDLYPYDPDDPTTNATVDMNRFKYSDRYYSFATNSTRLLESGTETESLTIKVNVAPFSSVNLLDRYTVSASLQEDIKTKFSSYYDVWAYLDVEVETPETVPSAMQKVANLTIETQTSGNVVSIVAKNNTNNVVNGVSVTGLAVYEIIETYSKIEEKPLDWVAYYWQYYTKDGTVYKQNDNSNYTTDTGYVYYIRTYTYSQLTNVTANTANGFTKSGTTFSGADVVLCPGEAIVFATATLTSATTSTSSGESLPTGQVVINATATGSATAPTEAMLINAGTEDAIILNPTSNSYYIMFAGTLQSTADTNITTYENTYGEDVVKVNYYIGIVRPGQIISVPMSSLSGLIEVTETDNGGGEITVLKTYVATKIENDGLFDANTLTNAGWHASAVANMETFFNHTKT